MTCSRLARLLKAGRDVEGHAAVLTPYSTGPRYPDVGGSVAEEEVEDAVRRAEEVLRWSRSQIS